MHKLLSLSLILVFLISCNKKEKFEDPKKILTSHYNAGSKIKTLEFVFKKGFSESKNIEELKYTVIKDTTIPQIGYKYKVESSKGIIQLFDGKNFKTIDNNKKEITLVNDQDYALRHAFRHGRTINELLSMNAEQMLKMMETNSHMILVGTENVNSIECYKIKDSIQQDMFLILSERYYSVDDHLLRKNHEKVYTDNNLVQEEKGIFSDIKINTDIKDEAILVSNPQDFKVEIFTPIVKEKSKELLEIGSQAPEWTLKDGDNNDVSLAQYKGKVVLLDFWGTWCIWCKVAMPKINELYEKYNSKGFEVVGISCREPKDADPVAFLKDKNYSYQTMLDGEEVSKLYNVSGFPTLYMLDKDGKIIFSEAGYDKNMVENLGKIIEENL